MSTPVLTQKQLRKSLSAKKGPIKGLKNVLAQPFENYWPVLKNDQSVELEILLTRLLPQLKRPERPRIPWSKLKTMSKKERLDVKSSQADANSVDNTALDSIVFGINSVTRLLEKDNVCSILLDSSVDPHLLVSHITIMAKNKNVPVFLVSFLKKVTVETIGFSASAIGLKKDVKDSSENYLYPLYEKISTISPDLTKSKASVSLFIDQNLDINSAIESELNSSNVEEKTEEPVKPFVLAADIYLHRESKKERVYKFLSESENSPAKESTDFIKISDYDMETVEDNDVPLMLCDRGNVKKKKKIKSKNNKDANKLESNKKTNKEKVAYKSLKIKRLQGNILRVKRTNQN